MSRLHSLRASIADVARYLDADAGELFTIPPDVTEGNQGLVMFEAGGRRRLRMMLWGFPRRIRDARKVGMEAEIIGLVADLTNPMWEQTVVDPATAASSPSRTSATPRATPVRRREPGSR